MCLRRASLSSCILAGSPWLGGILPSQEAARLPMTCNSRPSLSKPDVIEPCQQKQPSQMQVSRRCKALNEHRHLGSLVHESCRDRAMWVAKVCPPCNRQRWRLRSLPATIRPGLLPAMHAQCKPPSRFFVSCQVSQALAWASL